MLKWLRRLLGPVAGMVLLVCLGATEAGLWCLLALGNGLTGGLLTISTGAGSLLGGPLFRNIRYADGVDTVTIETLQFEWDPWQLFHGHISIQAIRGTGVQVLLGKGSGETDLTPFSLPLPLKVDTVTAEGVTIVAEQQEIWLIRTGTVSELTYQNDTIRAGGVSLVSDVLSLQATGELRTRDDYPLQLALESRIQSAGYSPILIHGSLNGPLNELRIEADAQTPFPAHLSGRLDQLLGATTWQAHLECPDMTMAAIRRDWPAQRFTQVIADGRGTFADYSLKLAAQTEAPGIKNPAVLAADLQGNGEGFAVTTLRLTHNTADLSASGMLRWAPAISWRADIDGTHLNPSLFLADWPGDISGSVTTSGQFTPQGIEAHLHLPHLKGTLRGFPLAGKGEIQVQNKQVRVPNFILHSGSSVLRLSGQATDTINLSLELDSANMAELWPGTRGKLIGRGQVNGSSHSPRLECSLTGNNLGIGNSTVSKVRLEAKGLLTVDGAVEGTLQAEQLQIGTLAFGQGRLRFSGSPKQHTVELESQSPKISLGAVLKGGLDKDRWHGSITQARFSGHQFGGWRQQQPASLEVSPEQAELTPFCLGTSPSAAFCIGGNWQIPKENWQLRATATALPLEVLQGLVPLDTGLSGRLDAEVDCKGQQSQLHSASVSATGSGLMLPVRLTDGSTHRLQWTKNVLRASYADNRLRVTLDNEMADQSILRAEATLANAPFSCEGLLRAPLSGSILIRLQDLRSLNALTGRTVAFSGVLQGQWLLGGTPAAPSLNGQMELSNGQAEILPLGITLSPLALKMTGDSNKAHILITAHSGKGEIKADSMLQLDQLLTGPHVVHLSGNGFTAAHLPELDLDVSPDLRVTLGKDQITANGTIIIPRAKIASIDLHQGFGPSADMVIIDEPPPVTDSLSLPLLADVTVVAGEDVQVDAYGLKGGITGKLTLHGQPGRPLVGNGTLSVEQGSFTVYGRRLQIGLGRLLFTGGPLTNPGIELRSERKRDKVTTGVVIGGFLQRPEMNFYSTPPMDQSAILTNLLESTAIGGETRDDTGFIGTAATKVGLGGMVPFLQGIKKLSMIDEIKLESGQEYDSFSLVFGSWLTPDFYVSYGKDLVKESGSFNTRYTLGKGFSFLTETGASESGGDIKYEFER